MKQIGKLSIIRLRDSIYLSIGCNLDYPYPSKFELQNEINILLSNKIDDQILKIRMPLDNSIYKITTR